LGGRGLEFRPPVAVGGDIRHRHGLARGEAIHARPHPSGELHDLREVGALARRGDELKLAVLVREEETAGIHVEQGRAHLDEGVHEVDHVVLVDEGVGDRDKGIVDALFPGLLGHGVSVPTTICVRRTHFERTA
jgi:hypothetical protein